MASDFLENRKYGNLIGMSKLFITLVFPAMDFTLFLGE